MVGQQSKRKQRLSPSSELDIIDSQVHSGNHGTNRCVNNMGPSKLSNQSKRYAVAKVLRRCVGKITHKLRLVTRDEDSHFVSSTAAQTPTNSNDHDQRLILVLDKELPSHENNLPSSSPSSPSSHKDPLHHQGKFSIDQHYQILPEITGEGIAGEVRKCIHRGTSKLFAVKTICKERIRRKDRIYREISFLKQVHHPNIIAMNDVYEDKDEVNIVMEMCYGGELFDKIVEKAALGGDGNRWVPSCFRERDAARIIHSILSATSYLHSKDIVHRDIKPENILFVEKDNDESPVKLIDFGLSIRHPQGAKPLTTTVGTAYYMAPELIAGSYDRSCDLWSIGAVTYVMLSGRPPFNGPTDDVIFKKILRGLDRHKMETSNAWNGVSYQAKDFIRCLLNMDPESRWTADMALEHPWLKTVRLEVKAKSRPAKIKRTVSC